MNNRVDVRGTASIIAVVIFASFIPLFLKTFTAYIDAWTANGLRYGIVVLIYGPWLLIARKKGLLSRKTWRFAIVPAAFNLVHQIFWALAHYFVDAGVIGFLVRLSTLWAIIGSFIFFAEERKLILSLYFWIGAAFNLSGFIAIVLGGNQTFTGTTAIGVMFVLFCSVLWAGYNISVRHFFRNIEVKTAFGLVVFYTSPVLLTLMVTVGEPVQVTSAPAIILVLIFLSAIVGLAINHILIYTAIKRLGVSITSTITLSTSFLTALLAHFILSESLSWLQWAGGATLVAGSALLIRAQKDYLGKPS